MNNRPGKDEVDNKEIGGSTIRPPCPSKDRLFSSGEPLRFPTLPGE